MQGDGPIIKNVNATPTSASCPVPHGEDGSVSLQVDSGRLPHDLQTFHGDVRSITQPHQLKHRCYAYMLHVHVLALNQTTP